MKLAGGGGKQRVSTAGGVWPQWRGDGKELFYHSPNAKIMAALVTGGTSLTVGAPVALFEFRRDISSDDSSYSVDRDGHRFLLTVLVEAETSSPLTVIVNWMAGVKK